MKQLQTLLHYLYIPFNCYKSPVKIAGKHTWNAPRIRTIPHVIGIIIVCVILKRMPTCMLYLENSHCNSEQSKYAENLRKGYKNFAICIDININLFLGLKEN